jgi:hypothetical protein
VKDNRNERGISLPASQFMLMFDPTGEWHCEQATSLYEGITCPEGHYKVAESDFEQLCESAGQPCPEGYSCYCQPCIKAFEVNVFPWENGGTQGNFDFNRDAGCDKMDVCGTVEQRKEILFHAFDSRQRGNATVTALVHLGEEQRYLSVHQVEPFLYEFGFSRTETGVAILEVYIDGIQIPESPFQIQVEARDCDADFPGQSRIPVSACVQLKRFGTAQKMYF